MEDIFIMGSKIVCESGKKMLLKSKLHGKSETEEIN